MSKYHIFGIRKDGSMGSLTDSDSREQAFADAKRYAHNYRQLFLAQPAANIQELIFTPPTEGGLVEGKYAPFVRED
ncbi:hypothetical protein LCGC14_1807190 [marine sediment metagenome]|uniref:Uncharacterized protein n=1 Tax=marine sediment metagenome TaxID=412755 RepID=A0A0F9J2G2_9ZZZZ